MKKHNPFYIIGFMVLLAALFGSGVTGIYLGAASTLRKNDDFLRQRSLITVFGLGDPSAMSKDEVASLISARTDMTEECVDPETGWRFTLMKIYEDDARTSIQAYGFPFRGPGFWGPIEGIVAVRPDRAETVGLCIVEQAETPGLGGRITEPIFTDQFAAGVAVSPRQGKPCLRISGDSSGDEHHVDAITGATQTSMAMDRILNDHLSRFHRAMAVREQALVK